MMLVRYDACWGADTCKEVVGSWEALGNGYIAVWGFRDTNDVYRFKEELKEKLKKIGVELVESAENISGLGEIWEYATWIWTEEYPDKPNLGIRMRIMRAIRQSALAIGYTPFRSRGVL